MDKQTKKAREQMKALGVKDKLANLWFYHKLQLILCVIAVGLVAFTVSECSERVSYDLEISYYSSSQIADEALDGFKALVTNVCMDIQENSSVDVGIFPCQADAEEKSQQTAAMMMQLSVEIAEGDSQLYLVDGKYMQVIEKNYPDAIEKQLEIGSIGEVRRALKLEEGQEVYLIKKVLYDSLKDNKTRVAKDKNADRVFELVRNLAAGN